jgi:ABC-type branched-subunit amino acid transport system substrate-binding protein
MKLTQRRAALLALLVTVLASACRRGEAPRPVPGGAPRDTAAPSGASVIGVIVPQTGPAYLRQYGELVLDGVRLAVQQQNAGGRKIELAVLDDGGDASKDAELVRTLEQRGAIAIIGPLLSGGVERAASARRDSTLVVISPTASQIASAHNAYSLNEDDVNGAAALAAYARSAGLTRVATLHSRAAEVARQAHVFADEAKRLGLTVVSEVPYDSGTTTFARQIRALSAARPQAVFIPASERDVKQLAPQLSYYGLTADTRILGGESWTGDEMLRTMEPKDLNGVIATTPLLRSSQDLAWKTFVDGYENTYRRTLDNPYPALGYDAALIVLSAAGGRVRAHDVSRKLAALRDFRGATGLLSVRDGKVSRHPFIVRIENRTLVPINTAAGAH